MGLRRSLGGVIAAIILSVLILFLAVDIGFSLYNPNRLTSVLPSCTLSIISGNVEVQTRDSFTWQKIEKNILLEAGSRIRTAPDSHALLTFFKGTTTKLEPGTDLIVVKLEGGQDYHQNSIVLEQRLGKTWNQVAKLPDNNGYFHIQTPSASVVVRGTQFLTEVDKSGKTRIETTEGQVDVSAHGQEVHVSAGLQTEVKPNSPPSVPAPIPPAMNELIVTFEAPVAGQVTDPSGSSTGYLLDGSTLNQIAGSELIKDADPFHSIRIREPNAGEYSVLLRGVDEGVISFGIEGLSEGKNTFQQSVSCNITAANEKIIRLHLDVLDGLLQGVSVLNQEATGSRAIESDAVVKSEIEPTGATLPITKPADSDDTRDSMSDKEKSPDYEETRYNLQGTYNYDQWIIIVSMFALFGVGFLVAWKKR